MARTMPLEDWARRSRPLLDRYMDGDTFCFESDLGHFMRVTILTTAKDKEKEPRIRLAGVKAPERYDAGGPEATAFTRQWLTEAVSSGGTWSLVVQTELVDSFGRFISWVWRVSDASCLNDALLESGHAVPYRT